MKKIFFVLFLFAKMQTLNSQTLLCVANSTKIVEYKQSKNEKISTLYDARLKHRLSLSDNKPLHILAKYGLVFAILGLAGAFIAPLLVLSSGYLTFEFGYLTIHLALIGVLLCLRGLSDMQKEPDRWAGKRRANWGLAIGTFVSLWIAAWFAAVVLKS